MLAVRTRWQRLRAPLTAAGIIGAGALALHLRDPHVSGSWGFCPFLAFTGFYCPGCGGLRAVNELTNLDLIAAAHANLVFVLSLPFIAWGFVGWFRGAWTGEDRTARFLSSNWFYVGLAVLLVVFMVVRNLPGFEWLTPAPPTVVE